MSPPDTELLLLGCYTHCMDHVPAACGEGIMVCALDPGSGEVRRLSLFGEIHNPTYLISMPGKDQIFAVTEFAGHGQVHQLSLRQDGQLSLIATENSHGASVCHLAALPDGSVAVAAYSGPSVGVYPVREGRLGAATRVFHYSGSGPNRQRQPGSHPHQVVVAPGERWLYVCDLGADCVWRHEIALEEAPVAFAMPSGSGPRHMVFHPELPYAYVLGELTGAVTVCDWSRQSGELAVRMATATMDDKDASGGAIRLHPSRRMLYISLRKKGVIRGFPLDEDGLLGEAFELTTEAGTARNFAIHPNGEWLVSADQAGDEILILQLDPASGQPTERPPSKFAVGTPACVLFAMSGE